MLNNLHYIQIKPYFFVIHINVKLIYYCDTIFNCNYNYYSILEMFPFILLIELNVLKFYPHFVI